jgi:uncharacterized membrane protein YccC
LDPAVTRQDEDSLANTRSSLAAILQRIRAEAKGALTQEERELWHPIARMLGEWLPRLDPAVLGQMPLKDPLQAHIRGAARHALRTFLALMAAIAFWNATGWQEGTGFLINAAAFCALASTASHPARVLLWFGLSTVVAAVAGFFFKFFLLPQADGYWSLMLCLAVVLVPLGCCMFARHPLVETIGATAGLFMLALVQPSNHMTYDPAQYVSSSIAAAFGAFFLYAVFTLILPTRPETEAASALQAFRRTLRGLVDWSQIPSFHTWRLSAHRQLSHLQRGAQVTPAQLVEGLRMLDYGSCLLRLRVLSSSLEEGQRAAVEQVLVLGRSAHEPARGPALKALTLLGEPARVSEELRATLSQQLRELLSLMPSSDATSNFHPTATP